MKKIFMIFFFLMFPVLVFADTEKQMIAETISAEAGGEGYTGMYLVANTIRNRAILYHKNPFQIVSQKNQYYGFTAKNKRKIYLSVKKEADFLAENLMNLPDKTNGAIYFRQLKERRLRYHRVETIRYKNHIFYK